MIIGTAGHIDHGKSTLMQALTGTHTDRLPEEKKRGISIELGYAFLDRPQGDRLAFVDVPGHEKLIHTMVAGATGMDHVLLLVAADDGVMPQTVEHLSICRLLGLYAMTAVITKVDKADAEQLATVHTQLDNLFADWPQPVARFEVAATTGQGVDALRQHVVSLQPSKPKSQAQCAFRMPIDRSFSLNGVGTVVTGSVQQGELGLEDTVVCSTQPDQPLRVRGLHAQSQAAQAVQPGLRCAINVAGVDKAAVPRGAWLQAPHLTHSTLRVDVQLTLLDSEPRALQSGTRVHVHWGTDSALASVAVLNGQSKDQLQPGETAFAQLVLQRPVSLCWGDRLLVRDGGASRSVAGALVLDVYPPARYRRSAERLAFLQAMTETDVGARLACAVQQSPYGVDLRAFEVGQGWRLDTAKALLQQGAGPAVHVVHTPMGEFALSEARMAALWAQVEQGLTQYHQHNPEELGPDVARLRRMCAAKWPEVLWQQLCQQWVSQGLLVRRGARLHLPAHAIHLSVSDDRIAQKVMPKLLAGEFDPPWVRDLAQTVSESETLVRVTLCRLASQGVLHQVVKDLFYPQDTMQRLARIARMLQDQEGEVVAARFRDETGLGRKRAIQILEFLDRVGFLRRVKDRHVLRKDTELFSEQEA